MSTEANFENDNLTVNSATVTTNVTAGTFTGDGSGITNLPGATTALDTCKTALVDNATINGSTTFTQINVFPTVFDFNVGGFTISTSGIVVPTTGIYLCLANIKEASSAERTNAVFKFTINGTAQSQTGAQGYIRNLNNHSSSSLHLDVVYSLTAGDEIGLAFAQLGNSGTVNLIGANSSVCLYRISS